MIKAKATRTVIAVVTAVLATAIAATARPWTGSKTATTSVALPHVMPEGVPAAQVGRLRTYLNGAEIAAAWKPLRYNTCDGLGAIRWSSGQLRLSTDGAADNGAAIISPGTYTSGIFEAKINFASAGHGKVADWPAFWLSSGWARKLAWPYGGELDAAEGLGGTLGITYHYNANGPNPSSPDAPAYTPTYQVTATPGWHVVTVVWTAHRFDVYYQGKLVKTISAPFVQNSPMNVIFDMTSGKLGQQPGQPASMDVAYVRIWTVN